MNLSGFISKVAHAVSANLVSLLISVLTTLLVPKALGVEEYGYFQLYLFYASYVGLLHFGWNDGVLLRLGGAKYEELRRDSIFSQFVVFSAQQVVAAISVALTGFWLIDGAELKYVILMIAICVSITGPLFMLLFILQATARIKEYARIVVVQRLLFGFLVVLVLLTPSISFEKIVAVELVGRMIALGMAVYACREVVLLNFREFSWPRKDIIPNLAGGFPLMVSSMAGSLIIGIVRFGIAENWSISIFGQVSLALSLATMVLTAIVAIGQVLFPLLRRASSSRLPKIYASGRMILASLTLPALLLYFAMVPFISRWLPEYLDTTYYLGLIFPLFVYQVRTSVLLEPYLKALRREKALLWVNLSVLMLSVLTTWFAVSITGNLVASLVSIVVLVAIRALALELIVSRAMSYRFSFDAALEAAVIGVFFIAVTSLGTLTAIVLLSLTVAAWYLMNILKIKQVLAFLRS